MRQCTVQKKKKKTTYLISLLNFENWTEGEKYLKWFIKWTCQLSSLSSICHVFSSFIAMLIKLTFLSHLSSRSQYLHKLFKRDHHKGQRYHEKQISLYAEYDRSNLLPFLRDSTHCPLEKVQPLTRSSLLSCLCLCLILLCKSEIYMFGLLLYRRPLRSASSDTLWGKQSFCWVSTSFCELMDISWCDASHYDNERSSNTVK